MAVTRQPATRPGGEATAVPEPAGQSSEFRLLLPAYLNVAALTATMFAHAASAPAIQAALGLNLTELGLLLSAMIVGHGVIQPFAGPIYNRLGPTLALRGQWRRAFPQG